MKKRRVFVLQDDLYEDTLSAHATEKDAQAAIERYLSGEVVRVAEQWWADFGPQGRLVKGKPGLSWEEFLASEIQCARENLRIEEHELS